MPMVITRKAKCGRCGSEFAAPDLGDFAYGLGILTGERGTAFAHVVSFDHPVFEFIIATLPVRRDASNPRFDLGVRAWAAFGHFADPVDGQRLCNAHVCPVCQSGDWENWGGEEVGIIEIQEVTHESFMSLPENERRQLVLDFDAR